MGYCAGNAIIVGIPKKMKFLRDWVGENRTLITTMTPGLNSTLKKTKTREELGSFRVLKMIQWDIRPQSSAK